MIHYAEIFSTQNSIVGWAKNKEIKLKKCADNLANKIYGSEYNKP